MKDEKEKISEVLGGQTKFKKGGKNEKNSVSKIRALTAVQKRSIVYYHMTNNRESKTNMWFPNINIR